MNRYERSMRMKRSTILGFVAVVLTVAMTVSAAGYVVILKNGEKIRCKEPMRIQGQQALITLSTGALTSYPLQLVDVVETERYNKLGLGDAFMIEELSVEQKVVPTPTPKQALGSVTSIDANLKTGNVNPNAAPTPSPTPGIKLRDLGYKDPPVTQAFERIFSERDLYIYRTSAGTQPDFFFVQTVTDSQTEVFKALRTVAEAYAVIHKLDAEMSPAAVELEMVETSGKAAGTFRLTPTLAEELATGKQSIEEFYVANVIF